MANISFPLGILGNVISMLMFVAPLKTFRTIVKKKSTEDFKGLPYITTLLSTCLWSFYGLMKPGGLLVVTVNGTGAILHIIYVTLFLIYAPRTVKIQSLKLVALIDVGFLGIVVTVTLIALHGTVRLTVVGILCAGLTIGMYASPLSVMRSVIRMKSVEYMPFFLSLFQFLNGGVWAGYALIVKDIYIGVPNGIGFLLGSVQLILYMIYCKSTKAPEKSEDVDVEMKETTSLPNPKPVKPVRQLSQKLSPSLSSSSNYSATLPPPDSINDIELAAKQER